MEKEEENSGEIEEIQGKETAEALQDIPAEAKEEIREERADLAPEIQEDSDKFYHIKIYKGK